MHKLWSRPGHAGWAPHSYERHFKTPWGAAYRAREEETVFGFLGGVMELHHLILEVGCGTGNYTVPVAHRCKRVVATDASSEMLQYLQGRLIQEGLANVETQLARLPNGLETSEKFDGALAVGVLNYVEGLEEALRLLASVLKPGGWVVFNLPLLSAEGRIYALTELVNRRWINILPFDEILALAERAGLQVEMSAPTGLTQGGLTLIVGAILPTATLGRFAS